MSCGNRALSVAWRTGRFGVADREKVEEAIALVGLKPLAHRLVDSLSGRTSARVDCDAGRAGQPLPAARRTTPALILPPTRLMFSRFGAPPEPAAWPDGYCGCCTISTWRRATVIILSPFAAGEDDCRGFAV